MYFQGIYILIFNAAHQGEISEVELLKDLLYVFQGIDGRVIRFDASSDHYLIDNKVLCEIISCVSFICTLGGCGCICKGAVSQVSRAGLVVP